MSEQLKPNQIIKAMHSDLLKIHDGINHLVVDLNMLGINTDAVVNETPQLNEGLRYFEQLTDEMYFVNQIQNRISRLAGIVSEFTK